MNDDDLNLRLSTHEAVCAERWRETILRIKRLENTSMTVAGTIIMLLIGIILKVN
jgi:predicted nucleic acid-binding Zn ribbon protein